MELNPHDHKRSKNNLDVKKKILIIDDNPDDREQCIRLLEKNTDNKFIYLEADSERAAIELILEHTPDCVLLDYSMPGRNGLVVLEQLITLQANLSVIMMTGQGNEEIAVRALKCGAQNYLVKSQLKPELLFQAVQSALSHSLQMRQISEHEEINKKMMQQLVDSKMMIERFLYVASHDLQEPIRIIHSLSDILNKEYKHLLNEEGKKYLELTVTSAFRALTMVKDILAYAQLTHQQQNFASFSSLESLRRTLVKFRKTIKAHKVHITYDKLPIVLGHMEQFEVLFAHLLSNSIKFQERGRSAQIHIGVEEREHEWCFSFKDNGIGIKAMFVEQIFQPFRRLHAWDDIQGTGLGLTICKTIIHNHGGQISVVSTPGTGSTIFFTIPKIFRQVNLKK